MYLLYIFGLAILSLAIFTINEENKVVRMFFGATLMLACIWAAIIAFSVGKEFGPNLEYRPAEYVAENETSTYFGTEDGHIFYVSKINDIDPYVPYILGIDNRGTQNVEDDIVMTVWSLCE